VRGRNTLSLDSFVKGSVGGVSAFGALIASIRFSWTHFAVWQKRKKAPTGPEQVSDFAMEILEGEDATVQ